MATHKFELNLKVYDVDLLKIIETDEYKSCVHGRTKKAKNNFLYTLVLGAILLFVRAPY